MLKILRYTIFSFGLCLFLSACKKELAGDPVAFAVLNLDNKTGYSVESLFISYDNQSLIKSSNPFSNIKIPAGKGKLSFKDSTGTPLLDTTFTFEANKTINWVLFQPSDDIKPVILENNGSSEPQPDAEHIKVKIANFIPKAFPKPFDIIFYWIDPDTFEFIEGGRIDNIAQNFPDKFNELDFRGPTDIFVMMLVDHQTQQPLLDDVYIDYISEKRKRILTLFIAESDYSPVTGTPYRISVKSLFEN